MKFYTNIQLVGNNVLVRGYENGKSVMFKDEFQLSLLTPTESQSIKH